MSRLNNSVVLTSSYDAAGNRIGLAANIDGVDDFQNVYQYDRRGGTGTVTFAMYFVCHWLCQCEYRSEVSLGGGVALLPS